VSHLLPTETGIFERVCLCDFGSTSWSTLLIIKDHSK